MEGGNCTTKWKVMELLKRSLGWCCLWNDTLFLESWFAGLELGNDLMDNAMKFNEQ